MIQACLKCGKPEHVAKIKAQCKTDYYKLMQDKYGHHLAEKLYELAFDELEKKAVQGHIMEKMDKYLVHMYASDMVESLYKSSKGTVKLKMFESVFGPKLEFLRVYCLLRHRLRKTRERVWMRYWLLIQRSKSRLKESWRSKSPCWFLRD